MPRMLLSVLMTMALLFAASALAAPKPAQTDPEWYLRQDTWQETVRQSREALARYRKANPDSVLPGAPQGVTFSAWHAIGPFAPPAGKDGFEFAYPPEQEVDFSKRYDGHSWKREHRPDGYRHGDIDLPNYSSLYLYRTVTAQAPAKVTVYVGCDDRAKVWLNGKQLLTVMRPSNGTAVELPLTQGENRLLAKIYNVTGGKAYSFSLTPKTKGGRPTDASPEAMLWALVARDFRDPADQRQIRWEQEDGIWDGEWSAGDMRTLAKRYAAATREQESLDTEATKLAGKVTNADGLDDIREVYYRSRKIEETMARIGGLDFAPLRRAITDLAASFGKRYPRGPQYLARLDSLEKLREAGLQEGIAGVDKLIRVGDEFETLRTEALLANPLLDFDRLLLIKRRGNLGLPQNWQGNCVMRGGFDNEIAVLSPVRPHGELSTLYRPESSRFVGDVELHWDAERLLFSMPVENKRYEIFEIGADGAGLRQVTPSEPDIDNYDACYLPDDRIIYDSTSCFQGVPCVGGGSQVANLHIMNPDGTGIRRLCFDQDHDWCPTVTNDGRVMFTRWEYSDTPHYFTRVVMRMNPDGTNQMALYGSNSYWPNSTFYARPIPGHPSKFVGIISGHHGVPRMGELIIFDPALGQHEADGVVQRIPGYGQKVEPIIRDQLVNDSWPRFLHPYPLSEKYLLTACQLNAESPWGIYLVDVFDNIVPICVEPGVAMLEPVPLRKTQRPRIIPDRIDTRRKDAVVHLSDVYMGGGLAGVPRGTVKQLRLFAFDYGYQGLANHTYIGIEGPWDVHRILGTAKVESDGSAAFRVPANTPLAVQPLDADGKALQLMRSWFVAMPGENISCVGCHERTTDAPPTQQTLAASKSPQTIQAWFGPERGFSFDREVQPMLDRYCVGCHNGDAYHGQKLTDLRQDNTATFSRAYQVLQQYVRRPGPESDYHMFPPAEYHADTSPLVQMLHKGHYGVKLPREAYERLYTWIDLNVPYFGTWHEFRQIPNGQRERRQELRKLYAGIDDDYEDIFEPPSVPIQPILFEPPQRTKAVPVECPDWPFDDGDAQRRQGDDRERKITLNVTGEKPLELTMVRIPAGEFVMGDATGSADEGPPCRVGLERPFWIAKTVITNEQFNLFDPAHDSRYLDRKGKDHSNRGTPLNQPGQPVVRVSWDRAMAFCEWLTERTGRRFTLPTEAQWEYACRAGAPPEQGGNGRVWGVDAMPASVVEWTRSDYRPYPYATDDGRNDAAREGRKVVRGAGAINLAATRRDTYRLSYPWWQGIWNVGLRVVCEDENPTPVVEVLAAQ
ncbi:MAG: SUMF1/EgtB/PvdO family nonheme iron enzyme [Pirellulaceae bacterium]|nr:SUMF1/EgtB/PvdO family nonheme iron enzyme [Pirellulaceae bacterium]